MALSAVPAFSNTKAYLCLCNRPLTGAWAAVVCAHRLFPPAGDFSRGHRVQLLFLETAAADTWAGGLPRLQYLRGRPSLAALSLRSKEGSHVLFYSPRRWLVLPRHPRSVSPSRGLAVRRRADRAGHR